MYIKVWVVAGAKRESVERISAKQFRVMVKEKPERNLANRKVCTLIAHALDVPASSVRIINGHHSPSKLLSVAVEEHS